MVRVRWAFNFLSWKPTQTEWTWCNQCIQQEERERIKKFYFQKDAKAAMIGRLLIRKLVAENTGIPYKDIKLSRTEKGKPYVTNHTLPFDFNVSHQGELSVIAAETGAQVGSDVMKLEPPRASGVAKFFDTMRKQFSEEEWKIIKSPAEDTEKLKLFFRHWCLKESYVKALGVGIGFEISRLNFTLNSLNMRETEPVFDTTLRVDGKEEKEWIFEEHLLANHCLAVAYQRSTENSMTENVCPQSFGMLDFKTLTDDAVPLSEPDEQYWSDFHLKPESPEHLKKSNKS